jgi:hypothetical protein
MVSSALSDLQRQLQRLNLKLNVQQTDMTSVIQKIARIDKDIHIHVCDLDAADNDMGYSPFSQLRAMDLPENVQVHSWTCHLREEPWDVIERMTDLHPVYAQKFNSEPLRPLAKRQLVPEGRSMKLEGSTDVPPAQQIATILQEALNLDQARCHDEKMSGLYGTHWGGLPSESVGESKVLSAIRTFVEECGENDQKWAEHRDFVGRSCRRNTYSLEHAAISWMMKGDGKVVPNTDNLIAGEFMTRYLTAPLMLGTVSPRRLWHSARNDSVLFTSSLKTIADAREWHKILAARNIRQDSAYSGEGDYQYGYWRWQGFLCRYAKAPCKGDKKQGVLLIHGFGASGSQWEKAFDAMKTEIDMGLSPDLLGFGKSEKPGITYTQYLWEAYVSDFVKEIAIGKEQWESFIIGGNSIGGYTSMGTAADDTIPVGSAFVSSRGAPGSGRCAGVVLMNSAGQLRTKEDIDKLRSSGEKLKSIAEVTSMGALPYCR